MDKHLVRVSKFLSLVLRHKPKAIGLALSSDGWVKIECLLEACRTHGKQISMEDIESAVASNDKQRFSIDSGRIRANQGHSIQVDLGLKPQDPPDSLFHGTATRFLESIVENGLKRMNRQHVHLSSNLVTAIAVGKRHGRPLVFSVDSYAMYNDGYEFFLSENGVWLTNSVPWSYLAIIESLEQSDGP